jgi:AraC-like DNA-binding protein
VLPAETNVIRRWSTEHVPQPKRLDYFAAALSEAVYPLGIDEADPRSFQAEVSFAHLGSIGLCKTVGAPHHSFRGRGELARTDEHTFSLLLTLETSWTAEHRGPLRLFPRDVLIIDSQFPLQTDIRTPFTAIAVAVSDVWMRQWLPRPNLLSARHIPGNSLWGHALSSFLAELTPELAAAPPLPLPVIADQVGSLLALMASAIQGADRAPSSSLRSLHDRIQDCIEQRCMESQLTAADVAASLNISVRTLHRAVAAVNETFGAKLIDARARVALRMLTSPLFDRVTTAEIGRRAGFQSASHFARVMRNRTGRTPMQLRRTGHTPPSELTNSEF